MARTKAFDPDAALLHALELFWDRGYEATSTQDLVDALGISRSSLYGTFGSKHELYARALERYGVIGIERVQRALRGRGPVWARLRRALLALADEDLDAARARGCFAANAALELSATDATVRRLVAASFAHMRETLRTELARAVEAGELPADTDVEARSAALLATVQGILVLAKGTGDRQLVEAAVDASLPAG